MMYRNNSRLALLFYKFPTFSKSNQAKKMSTDVILVSPYSVLKVGPIKRSPTKLNFLLKPSMLST